MAFGDIARTDEYGDDLADPFAAAAYRQQRRYLGRNVVGAPEEQRGSPPLWNPVELSPVQRSANEMLLQQPLWNEPQMRKPLEAMRHTAEAMAFPADYARVGTDINPKNLITPNVLAEEDVWRADDMKRRGLNWGAKTATSFVGDPVPGLVALARGQSLRGSMGSVGSAAGPLYHGSERTNLNFLNPSTRGPLGPGTYFSSAPGVAERYAGPQGRVYELSPGRDVYRGEGHRTDAEWFGYKNDTERLIAAAEPEKQAAVKAIVDKAYSGDGYPMFWDLSRLYGSQEAAQGLFKRAGFQGLSGQIDGPETVLFGPRSVTLGAGAGQGEGPAAAHLAKPFFSAVESTIAGSPLKQAPAAQWAGTIRNAPGVKPAELEQLGLEPWLGQQQGAVPKQALADYVAANKVQVGEVGRSDIGSRNVRSFYESSNPVVPWEQLTQRERQHWVGEADKALPRTKFSQYQLPGGENYRETLLTLPSKSAVDVRFVEGKYRLYDNKLNDWVRTPDGRVRTGFDSAADAQQAASGLGFTAGVSSGGLNFRGTHWDEPNVLAHYRTNDRIIGGKRTLFGEELQSDWLQTMRKKEKYEKLGEEIARSGPGEPGYRDLLNKHWQLGATLGKYRDQPVPPAPFQNTWHELAIKRMIRDAAEGGYEQLAWTPGSVQNKRFPDPARPDTAMEGFYDKMWPVAASKIGKPYGAQVGRDEMFTPNALHYVPTLPITPQLRDQALYKGFSTFAVPGAIGLGALADPSRYRFPEEQYQ